MAESITLQTSDSNVQQSDVLGRLSFAASNESSASDARLIGASIYAAAESDFTEISNATSLIFATASSENAQEAARINSDGYLGINTNNPSYHLHVNGTIFGTSILENGHPVIISDITTASGSDVIENIISLTQSEYNAITPASGTVYIITDGSSATPLTGSGLTNYISKWNNTYELTNSLIYDNGSGVGIGNTNPLYTLDVSGTGNFTFLRSSGSPVIVSDITTASGSDIVSNIISLTQSEYNAITPSSGTFYVISDAVSNYIEGSGVTNYLPKWSGVNYLTSGIIYDDGNNIGIGTSSPSARLNIEGGNFIFNDAGNNWDFRIEGDSDENLLFADASNNTINIGTGTSTGSKLLVSTSNSRSYQHILASGGIATESSFIRVANDSNTTSDSFAGFVMSATRSGSSVAQIASIASIATNASTHQPNIVFFARNSASTFTELMRINHLGDVGIATASPAYKLDVVGTGNFSQNLLVNGTAVSVSGHSHTSSNITDFSTSVSGLLPVKNIVAGSNITISSTSGIFTINSTASGGGTTETIHPFLLGGM